MNLLDRARQDLLNITSNGGDWAFPVRFESPDSPPVVVTVNCTGMRHHLSVDNEGVAYKGRVASITVAEKLLTDLSYPVRNNKHEVMLKGHKVTWTDAANITRTYTIDTWLPDELLGVIVCQLGDHKNG